MLPYSSNDETTLLVRALESAHSLLALFLSTEFIMLVNKSHLFRL